MEVYIILFHSSIPCSQKVSSVFRKVSGLCSYKLASAGAYINVCETLYICINAFAFTCKLVLTSSRKVVEGCQVLLRLVLVKFVLLDLRRSIGIRVHWFRASPLRIQNFLYIEGPASIPLNNTYSTPLFNPLYNPLEGV